jgi:hypothetical protein
VRYGFGVFASNDRTMLLTRGDREIALEPQPARADERASLEGRYRFGDRARDSFIVTRRAIH